MAVNTGLRASELASLTPESFELGDPSAGSGQANRSLVRCQAGYTKNGQDAELPMRRDVAAMIRAWLAEKPADQPVWPGKWAAHRHGAACHAEASAKAEDDPPFDWLRTSHRPDGRVS